MNSRTISKIIGGSILGIAIMTSNREARVGLSLIGTALIFPKEAVKILDAIASNPNQYQTLSNNIPFSFIGNKPKTKIGIVRRFGKWNVAAAKKFWAWFY